jgi:predicted HicB family RNase H-like nuclease
MLKYSKSIKINMKKDRENVSVRMSPKVHEAIQIAAIKERRRMADLIEDACKEYLLKKS